MFWDWKKLFVPAEGISGVHQVWEEIQGFLNPLLGPLQGRLLDVQQQQP